MIEGCAQTGRIPLLIKQGGREPLRDPTPQADLQRLGRHPWVAARAPLGSRRVEGDDLAVVVRLPERPGGRESGAGQAHTERPPLGPMQRPSPEGGRAAVGEGPIA